MQSAAVKLSTMNQQRAAVLDFYKNTTLIDACTGQEIDKDATIQALCDSDNVSMEGLDEALEGVDDVTQKELDESEEIFDILGITDIADKLKFLSGNPCGDDWQWSMPKIDWSTLTCDQIFAQIVKALWGQALFVKCYGGAPNFQFDRYFTNMSHAKSCGQSSFTFEGLNVTGSFEVDFTLSANIENLTLTGVAISGVGNAENNYILGNALNNILDGDVGNDTLDGAGGSDILLGGQGNDTYIISDISASVVEAVAEGTDTVFSSVDYVLAANVENLTLTGLAGINGTGNALNNVVTGNVGNNLLYSSAGADTLVGGAGNDTYVITNFGSITGLSMVELANEGTDTVQIEASFGLNANIENLELLGTGNYYAFGNALDNYIAGNSGNNLIGGNSLFNPSSGNDTLFGGDGNDTFVFNSGVDNYAYVLDFTSGQDNLQTDFSYSQFISGAGLSEGVLGISQIIYDTNTGNLYYEDGLDIDLAINFAILLGAPTLSAADIYVYMPQ